MGRLLIPTLITFLLGLVSQPLAQACEVPNDFQGRWQWAVQAQSKEELPLSLRDMKLEDVPRHSLVLDIEQRGKNIKGRYAATANFLAKIEDGVFTVAVKDEAVQLDLKSAFGGNVTVELELQSNKLYWTLVTAEGEHYFPDEVVLERHHLALLETVELCSSLTRGSQVFYLFQERIKRTIIYDGFNAKRAP